MLRTASSPLLGFQSPPSRSVPVESSQAEVEPAPSAAVEDKTSLTWGKIALGAVLGATVLTACGSPTPPAADPGSYQLEDPDVIVMSESIQRIDLRRETTEECTGFGEEEECDTENVDYHQVGIHLGEGVVQDLNGNLFAAPQLVAPGAPGLAVSSPDSVKVDGPLWSNGSLERTEDGNYELRGWLFEDRDIDVADGSIRVSGAFGAGDMSVTNEAGVTTITEGWNDVTLVQSQGSHVLVQSQYGRPIAEIEHDRTEGTYKVDPDRIAARDTVMTYDAREITRKNGGWNGDAVVTEERSGRTEYHQKSGRHTVVSTTVTDQGWKDEIHSFLGDTTTYSVEGGQYLPGAAS